MSSSPAPRDIATACAFALEQLPTFRLRYDPAASKWRDLSTGARLLDFAEVLDTADTVLRHAIEEPSPPLAFRAVLASDYVEAARLDALTDWEADRATRHAAMIAEARADWEWQEASKARERDALEALLASDPRDDDLTTSTRRRRAPERLAGLAPQDFLPPPPPPLVAATQRERWRRALKTTTVREAIYRASGRPGLRYAPAATGADFERAWLASLPRVPGARLTTAALRQAYEAACPPGVRPLPDRALKPLAVEVLGNGDEAACRRRTRSGFVYLDVALPPEPPQDLPERPALRLIQTA